MTFASRCLLKLRTRSTLLSAVSTVREISVISPSGGFPRFLLIESRLLKRFYYKMSAWDRGPPHKKCINHPKLPPTFVANTDVIEQFRNHSSSASVNHDHDHPGPSSADSKRSRYTNLGEMSLKPFRKTDTSISIGVLQLNCTEDKHRNLVQATRYIRECAQKGAEMIFLPEAFDYIANSHNQAAELSEPLDGPVIKHYQQVARDNNVWLSLGGFHERLESLREDGRPWMANTHLILDDEGSIIGAYRKVHLFENGEEGKQTKAGEVIPSVIPTPIGNIGLAICYDLRFPEFCSALRVDGANIMTFPSAFTVETGAAHWESLLRARAIENQCYVIAAAQTGVHTVTGRKSYGHSMVVDPWGNVCPVVLDGSSPGFSVIDIDHGFTRKVRTELPVFGHRKVNIYYGPENPFHGAASRAVLFSIPSSTSIPETFTFGAHQVDKRMIFLESQHSRAFVNRKCVLPGHVLVISKRNALRLTELSSNETSDLFNTVKFVQKVMEELHTADSSTVCVQDGPNAGQTVQHVHVHILPRIPMDFLENDTIYSELAKHDKPPFGDKGIRLAEEMINEANAIRAYIRTKYPYKLESSSY